LDGQAIVVAEAVANSLERRARVIAFMVAALNAIWLAFVAFRVVTAGRSDHEGSTSTLVVLGGLTASASYALARRATIPRSRERLSKSWKDRINPWNVSLLANGLWGCLALIFRPQFFVLYASFAGAAFLLSLVGRSADGRPYR
jgi:hypothetical protein